MSAFVVIIVGLLLYSVAGLQRAAQTPRRALAPAPVSGRRTRR